LAVNKKIPMAKLQRGSCMFFTFSKYFGSN